MFSAVSRLGLTVPSVFGESATSFAARLARRNGAPRLIPFCSDMGLDHRALTNGNETEILRLAALAGGDPRPLLFWTPRLVAPGWFQVGHERIKFTALARTRIRTCLSEGPDAHAAIWQLGAIRRCTEHGRLLVNLPVSSGGREMFDHAFHVAQLGKQKLDAVPAPESSLEAYLLERIMRGPGRAWIDRLPFHVAAQTCENVGALIVIGPDTPRDKITDSEWQQAGAVGFSVLKQGPQTLTDKVKDLQRASPLDAALYRSRYRLFFDWLGYRDEDLDFDVTRELVRDFIFQNDPIAEGAMVLGKPCPRQFVPFSTASRAYGVTRWQLCRRLADPGLAQRTADGRDFQLMKYTPTEIMEQIAGDFGALLNAGNAAQWLGIARFLMAKLTDGGVMAQFFDDKNASPR